MVDSSQVGSRFEQATLKLFLQVLPRLGFEVVTSQVRRSGTQKGFDLLFQARPQGSTTVQINFFVECKGATSVNQLPVDEFEGKPDQLVNSRFNPDYWILFSPLRYLSNELQENLQYWKRQYPFALLTWVRETKDERRAGTYLDLFKLFPEIYDMFRADVPENIRDLPAETTLEKILDSLQSSIKHAYDEFEDRVVFKGLLPGVRRITPQSILRSQEVDTARLNRIRRGYYMLNSSDRFIWKVVCNDIEVRNQELTSSIERAVDTARIPIESLWILGAPGCGKTTQMNRSAVNFAMANYPVVLINALELDEKTSAVEYEQYLRKIYAIHNSSVLQKSDFKPLLVSIDNPAARLETIIRLLDRFDGLEDNFQCIFLLYEREVRYHQAEEESFLPDFLGGNNKNIYVDHSAADFKHKVFESFAAALDLPASERGIAEEAFMQASEISLAEAVINFCKLTNNNEYRRFAMDWVDFDEVVDQLKWSSLSDLYKLISIVYQFGVALPISMLPKLLPGFNENQFLDFQDFFTTNLYDNLPVIIEGKVLRARHELISKWHVQEKLSPSIGHRLIALIRAVDLQDSLERSVLTTLLGRKQIVRRYFSTLEKSDIEAIQQRAEGHPLTQRILMMTRGWAHIARREYSLAQEVFKELMQNHPRFSPPILEAAKLEFALKNWSESELLLQKLMLLEVNSLHARTELSKVYQAQKRYAEAEQVLKQCVAISPNDLNSRTELAKVYQAQKRYAEAEQVLKVLLCLDTKSLQARTELAKVYQVQKRYAEAEEVLTELIDLDTASLQARTELAKVYQVQKRYTEAEHVLKQLIHLDPKSLHARTELSKVYQVQKRYGEAEQVLKECIAVSPNDLNARTELSKVYQVQKRYAEAEQVLKESLAIDPDHLHALTELAKVYQVQKGYAEAEQVLEGSLAIDPDHLHTRTELGKVYQVQKRYEQAEQVLKRCVEISPNDLNSRTELAKVYQAQKRYTEAEHVLKQLIDLDAKNLQGRTELAKVYQAQKRLAEAEQMLKECIAISPHDLISRTELAKVYQAQRWYAEAEQVLKESIGISPNDVFSRTELAKVYQAQKRYAEAERMLKEALTIDPDQLHIRTQLTKVYQAQKRYAEAEQVLKERIAISSNNLISRKELARIYQTQKRYAEAEQVLKEALAIEPDQPHLHTQLAKVYQGQKRYAEAEQMLKKASTMDPDQLHPHTELARTYIQQGMFRRARAEVKAFLDVHQDSNPDEIDYLTLTFLNACYLMKRYKEGVALVESLKAEFVSPELSEEYGRLLRNYDSAKAVTFFQLAIDKFPDASRLLSEAAICFKLAALAEAHTVLERAIQSNPSHEVKYRNFFEKAKEPRPMEFIATDQVGIIDQINETNDVANRRVFEGLIRDANGSYRFWSNRYGDELFAYLQINDEVFFDVSAGGQAVNVEPMF